MKATRVKAIGGQHAGRTGVIVRSIGMCYDVRMDDDGEVLSGGKKRWRRIVDYSGGKGLKLNPASAKEFSSR